MAALTLLAPKAPVKTPVTEDNTVFQRKYGLTFHEDNLKEMSNFIFNLSLPVSIWHLLFLTKYEFSLPPANSW